MKKIILSVMILVLIGLGIYYTGVWTYFVENRINEELPQMTSTTSVNPQQTVSAPKTTKAGNFVDADSFHKGSGRALIVEYPDGKKILRFEDFKTINGPDLYVYLSETKTPTSDLKRLGEYLDLGRLKGNIGNQNYELPPGIDVNKYKSVIIWCRQFGVLFPYAILQ